ncbi:MAG TPA: Clp protease N-terminal domain-containing protein [Actinomycetota bacterium]|nr:Clp protease N-terminal domain-containing protein [Actinomycetota bacterium]
MDAQAEAMALRHGYLGTEHLLLGLLHGHDDVAARALDLLGIRSDDVRSDVIRLIGTGAEPALDDADAEALRSLGIDLDEVRRRVEDSFGPGALDRPLPRGRGRCDPLPGGRVPFTPRSKKVLELSVREARALGHGSIGPEHILLGLGRTQDGVAAEILAARGATAPRVRAAVLAELGRDLPGRSA